jgi:hypothetical protein
VNGELGIVNEQSPGRPAGAEDLASLNSPVLIHHSIFALSWYWVVGEALSALNGL